VKDEIVVRDENDYGNLKEEIKVRLLAMAKWALSSDKFGKIEFIIEEDGSAEIGLTPHYRS
jgi:hypothetical protein